MVQSVSPYQMQGMYPTYQAGGYPSNYNPVYSQQNSQAEEKSKKGGTFIKTALKTIGAVVLIAGGLVLANKKGWVKQVDNPTKTWDKIQTTLAKSGNNIEMQTLNWYNRVKKFITKEKETKEIIKKTGLEKTVTDYASVSKTLNKIG